MNKKTVKKYNKVIFRPDSFYGSYWLAKFINKFMKSGQKQIIERITMNVFNQIKVKTGKRPLYIFFSLLIRFRPLLGFMSKRFGKQVRKIPVPLHPRRQSIVALKWLTLSIKTNRFNSLEKRMFSELIEAGEGQKTSLSKRYTAHLDELNKNRLNHRFRWK